MTNLRVIWTSADYQRVNLCELTRSSIMLYKNYIADLKLFVFPFVAIGYHTVSSVTTKRVNSVSALLLNVFVWIVLSIFAICVHRNKEGQLKRCIWWLMWTRLSLNSSSLVFTSFQFCFKYYYFHLTTPSPLPHTQVPDSSRLFSTVMSVYRAYETSKPYRELNLRSALLGESKELKLLPREQLYTKVSLWRHLVKGGMRNGMG